MEEKATETTAANEADTAEEAVGVVAEDATEVADKVGEGLMEQVKHLWDSAQILQKIMSYLTENIGGIIIGIIVLVLGYILAKFFQKLSDKITTKNKVDPTVCQFINRMTFVLIFGFAIVAFLNRIGIQTTSIVAIVGACGLAIGLAFQSTLANIASGFMLVIFRPIKVNDLVNANGELGIVKKIDLFTTYMTTVDERAVIIPNSKVIDANIINYTDTPYRRVDIVIGISYGSDIKKAKQLLMDLMVNYDKVLKDPEPNVLVLELADSSVNLGIRPWCNNEDYWVVWDYILTEGKRVFDENGIQIPFPQRDVHIFNEQTE
ncbi:MAG: mechanosensitive ion channel [Lentisphaeria bacterium]|nr:mechanosensitive ion channel [Lentisphaeria bacterium]